MALEASVVAVNASATHSFSKLPREGIVLLEGLGVEGDAHCGATVQHRWSSARQPGQPNLRQVHLMQQELLDELADRGFSVRPGELGENVTTRGISLLDLPQGARLHIGPHAVVEVKGLRTPCVKIDRFRKGLRSAVTGRASSGRSLLRSGVMGVVAVGGPVLKGDGICVELPDEPHLRLEAV